MLPRVSQGSVQPCQPAPTIAMRSA